MFAKLTDNTSSVPLGAPPPYSESEPNNSNLPTGQGHKSSSSSFPNEKKQVHHGAEGPTAARGSQDASTSTNGAGTDTKAKDIDLHFYMKDVEKDRNIEIFAADRFTVLYTLVYEHKVKALVWTMALRRGEDDGPEVVRITKGKWTDTKTLTFVDGRVMIVKPPKIFKKSHIFVGLDDVTKYKWKGKCYNTEFTLHRLDDKDEPQELLAEWHGTCSEGIKPRGSLSVKPEFKSEMDWIVGSILAIDEWVRQGRELSSFASAASTGDGGPPSYSQVYQESIVSSVVDQQSRETTAPGDKRRLPTAAQSQVSTPPASTSKVEARADMKKASTPGKKHILMHRYKKKGTRNDIEVLAEDKQTVLYYLTNEHAGVGGSFTFVLHSASKTGPELLRVGMEPFSDRPVMLLNNGRGIVIKRPFAVDTHYDFVGDERSTDVSKYRWKGGITNPGLQLYRLAGINEPQTYVGEFVRPSFAMYKIGKLYINAAFEHELDLIVTSIVAIEEWSAYE